MVSLVGVWLRRLLIMLSFSLLTVTRAVPSDSASSPEAGAQANDGALLANVEQQNRLIANQIRALVDNELSEARARRRDEPSAVEQRLKLILERVLAAPELEIDARTQLRQRLETALRVTQREAATRAVLDQQIEEARAASMDRMRLADALARNREKIKQLVDRFESLMDEGRYTAADQIASVELPTIAPELPIAAAAALVAHATGARAAIVAQRSARQKAVVETLATAEVAMVPFADDQPIIFGDAAAWEELTLGRRKYRSVDLRKSTPEEQRIREALGRPTAVEFIEQPLADVVNDLKDLHDIEIQLDDKALDDAAVGRDTPITLPRLKGISLRSVLAMLRKKYGLYYLIQGDILWLTSKQVAEDEENLVPKVYPVGDLVVPIVNGRGPIGNGPFGNGMMNGMGPGSRGNGPINGPGGAPGNGAFGNGADPRMNGGPF